MCRYTYHNGQRNNVPGTPWGTGNSKNPGKRGIAPQTLRQIPRLAMQDASVIVAAIRLLFAVESVQLTMIVLVVLARDVFGWTSSVSADP